jgi:predicted RNA-binding protein with PUA-like domain
MNYWLMKSEPDAFSVDDHSARANKTEPWTGVRNYQARNFMRDDMKRGDPVFFYHSSCALPGIVGIMKVSKNAYPDETQFDRESDYFDPKSTRENPRWVHVDVKLTKKTRLVSIDEMRSHPELESMQILRRGNRLSITPVTEAEWQFIVSLI